MFYLQESGYRLPVYYTPAGTIVYLNGRPEGDHGDRIYSADGQNTASEDALYTDDSPVTVTMDHGTGIMKPVPFSFWRMLYDFRYFVVLSILFFLIGLWFIEYGRDFHLAAVSLVFSGFYFTSVIVLAYNDLNILWQISSFALIPAVLNMSLRTTGKNLNSYLLLGEIILILFLSLIAWSGRHNPQTHANLSTAAGAGFLFSAGAAFLITLENALKKNDSTADLFKRKILTGGIVSGLIIPAVMVIWSITPGPDSDPYLIPFLLSFSFPAGLIYGTYRIHITPFQFIFSRSLLAALLTIFFIFIYSVVLLTHSMLLPEQEESHRWIVNIVFLLILIFFLDPARKKLEKAMDKKIFRLRGDLTESLNRLSGLFASPGSFQVTVKQFIDEIQNVLQAGDITILLSDNAFPDLNLKSVNILRLPLKSRIWKYIHTDSITVTSYLMYGGGGRGELYQFLTSRDVYLIAGITGEYEPGKGDLPRILRESEIYRLRKNELRKIPLRSAMMVGNRPGKRFTLMEIRYIQEAARMGAMLLANYYMLIQELEKRKKMREILTAGQFQESLGSVAGVKNPRLDTAFFNHPVMKVSGDYIDIIGLDSARTVLILGDVSGHGLGSGYLVSTIRAMVRQNLKQGADIIATVSLVNRFLSERYTGNDYFTMFFGVFNTENGVLEYVNAAHPAPILYYPPTEDMRKLESTESILGIIQKGIRSHSVKILPGERLYLYSDGVTETLNADDRPFGYRRLHSFLISQSGFSVSQVAGNLKKELESYRGSAPVSDDTSFMALEYRPE